MTLYMKYQEERDIGREEGRQEKEVSNIQSLMKKLNISAVQAMDLLSVPENEQKYYLTLLDESGIV